MNKIPDPFVLASDATSAAIPIPEHVTYILNGGPNNFYHETWKKHIRKARDNVRKVAERIAKKVPDRAAKWFKYVDDVTEWLENPFNLPPPAVPG